MQRGYDISHMVLGNFGPYGLECPIDRSSGGVRAEVLEPQSRGTHCVLVPHKVFSTPGQSMEQKYYV